MSVLHHHDHRWRQDAQAEEKSKSSTLPKWCKTLKVKAEKKAQKPSNQRTPKVVICVTEESDPRSESGSRLWSVFRSVYPRLWGCSWLHCCTPVCSASTFCWAPTFRVMGVGDAATAQRVMNRYGRTLLDHQIRVLLFYATVGAFIGCLIQVVILLWERSSAWPSRKQRPRSLETPLTLPPSPWPLGRRIVFSAVCALVTHLFLLSRAIILRPALFAEALYDRGGRGKSLMVWLTHGSGGVLLWMLGWGFVLPAFGAAFCRCARVASCRMSGTSTGPS